MRFKILLIFHVAFLLFLTANCQQRIFNKSHEPKTHHFYGSLGIKNDQLFLNFYQKFKDSLNVKDSTYISDIIQYPTDVSIDKKDITIKNKNQFIKFYSKIFTNELVYIVNKYSKVDDFTRDMYWVSIGLGEIWFNNINDKENSRPQFKIIAINPIIYPRPEFEKEKR